MPHSSSSTVTKPVVKYALQQWRQSGTCHTLPVEGRSMWPLLCPGDEILVDFGRNTPQPHDIIVFSQHDKTIVHRVLNAEAANAIVTRGDNSLSLDLPVDQSAILGTVLARTRANQTVNLVSRFGRIRSRSNLLISRTRLAIASLLRRIGFSRPNHQRTPNG